MSKICIGVILDCPLNLFELQNNLKKKGRKYGIGISFDLNYQEHFMEYYSDQTAIFVDFNDNENSSNCEMLLLPDDCCYNGLQNEIPFNDRMLHLKNISEYLITQNLHFELFIGDSGTEYYEFQEYHIIIDDFLNTIQKNCSCYEINDLHIVFEK